MTITALRWIVATLAVALVGGTLSVMVPYLVSTWRNKHAPGRLLARHVVEVSAGTCGLVSGYALAIYGQLGGEDLVGPTARLWVYMVSMVLLGVGIFDVGAHQRRRRRQAESCTGRHHL